MKLEQQVVSLELAKRLKELGVFQERSLFAWSYWMDHAAGSYVEDCHEKHWEVTEQNGGNMGERYDAFTSAELGEMLPAQIEDLESRGLWNLTVSKGIDRWRVHYGTEEKLATPLIYGTTEAEARAKMLIHIIENKLLTLNPKEMKP